MSGNALQAAIRRLARPRGAPGAGAGDGLTAEDAAAAFEIIMRGEATAAQVAALLVALRVKGETADEVAGVARALRAAMVELPARDAGDLVDTCGTGGGAVPTFNISTAAALLAAGAGVRIAKHGNRSFTSRCGSADVLEALGVAIDVPVETMARALEEAGIVFMFAPLMHPAMRHVGPVRRELAIPTVMNIVGPLANPARAGRQVIGVAEAERLPLIAGALATLGARHALVVHGEPGMDELSPLGDTRILEVRDGQVSDWRLAPRDFGIGAIEPEELAGGDPADNARMIEAVLAGRAGKGPAAAVVLNAAAAIYVSGRVRTFADGMSAARDALAAGNGMAALERLRRAYGR